MSGEEFDSRMGDGEDPYALVAEDHRRRGRVTVHASSGASLTVELGTAFTSEVTTATRNDLVKLAEQADEILRQRHAT